LITLRISSAFAATAALAVGRRVSTPKVICASFGTLSIDPRPVTVMVSVFSAAS